MCLRCVFYYERKTALIGGWEKRPEFHMGFPLLKLFEEHVCRRLALGRPPSVWFDHSFGISGGLAMLPGLFFCAAAALSLRRGCG